MPTISLFFGIIVKMYYLDNKTHNMSHIHADDLIANWKLAITGNATYRIDGLK